MPTPATPSSPNPAGDDRNLVAVDENYVALGFEDKLRLFLKRNGTMVLGMLIAVLLVIAGRGGWDYLQAQKELATEGEYAAAGTPEKLKAFALAHPGHSLAGVAYLRLGDEAYEAGKTAEALTNYGQAVTLLPAGPLASRARLGLAMTKVLGGKVEEGATELRQLADDAGQFKGVRAEAAYQLASLAAASGKVADVEKYSNLVMQVDPASPWTQRAMAVRASLLAPTAAAPASEATPAVQIKLPGK